MPPGIGYSFSPSDGDINLQQNGTAGGGGLSPQEAVKILSLRIPARGSDRSPIPLPLLQAAGGAGGDLGAAGWGGSLNAMLQALMGAFSAQPGGGASVAPPGGGVAQPPSITPVQPGGPPPPPRFGVPNQPQQPIDHPGRGSGRGHTPLEGAPDPLFNMDPFPR